MGVSLLIYIAGAIGSAIISQIVDYVIKNRHMLWASAEMYCKQKATLVAEMTAAGWHRHDAAIESTQQTCYKITELIAESRAAGCHQCIKTMESVRNILTMEVRWAY